MILHFEFDSKNRVLRVRMEGHVTDRDLKNFYATASKCAATLDPLAGILDMSSVDTFEVKIDTIRELARLTPVMPDPSRTRVFIAPAPHVFGMTRMFEMLGADTRPLLHVVRTEQEAFAILGIQDAQFKHLGTSME